MAFRQLSRSSIGTVIRQYSSSSVPVKSPPPGILEKPAPETSAVRLHPPPASAEYKSQGTSVGRTIRNIWKAGIKRAIWQITEMNDTKVFQASIGLIVGWNINWC